MYPGLGGVIKQSYSFDERRWNAIETKNMKKSLSVDTVKGLRKVHEDDGCTFLADLTFFDDSTKRKDLGQSRSSSAKAILIWSEERVNMRVDAV